MNNSLKELVMRTYQGREYIRHPSDIPIVIQPESNPNQLNLALNNVSRGGLAFDSPTSLESGSVVNINIHIVKPTFKVKGIVQWCKSKEDHFEVGIQFVDTKDAFRVRMVEQICHIEQYRRQIKQEEGRSLSGEAAALEWITKHAAEFPNPDSDLNGSDESKNHRPPQPTA